MFTTTFINDDHLVILLEHPKGKKQSSMSRDKWSKSHENR